MEFSTKRCLIRPFIDRDIDAFMEYRNDMNWMKYQGFKGLKRQDYERRLLAETNVEEGRQFAVTELESGRVLGDIYLKREDDILWVGYSISPQYARRGFASEVLRGVINWAVQNGISCLKAGVMEENEASIGLLKKLGFQHLGRDENREEIYELKLN